MFLPHCSPTIVLHCSYTARRCQRVLSKHCPYHYISNYTSNGDSCFCLSVHSSPWRLWPSFIYSLFFPFPAIICRRPTAAEVEKAFAPDAVRREARLRQEWMTQIEVVETSPDSLTFTPRPEQVLFAELHLMRTLHQLKVPH